MKVYDKAEMSTRKRTPEGFLVADGKLARVGVQVYRNGEAPFNGELPEELRAKDSIRVLRPADEVFNEASVATYKSTPLTNEHPSDFVTTKNVKDLQVGFTKDAVERDGWFLKGALVVQDEQTIRDIEGGKDQLSVGYDVDVAFDSGDDPEFGSYDAVFRNIRANHVAIVSTARAGFEARIQDKGQPKMKTRVIDGITVEFTDQGAEVVDKMIEKLQAVDGQIEALEAKANDQLKDIEKLKGELDAKDAQQVTDADIEARVADRVALVEKAKKLDADVETEGKGAREIKEAVIAKVNDGLVTDEKSDDYVNAVFDTLVSNHKEGDSKQVADALEASDGKVADDGLTDSQRARAAMVERNRNMYKGGK